MAYQIGEKHVFGVQEPKPFNPPIDGKVRLRMRNKEFAKAYVKTSESVTCYAIKDIGDFWQLSYQQAINLAQKG